MRDVSAAWRDYIELTSNKTTVKCLRVVTRDHVMYGATTHTRDIIFESETYYTSAGLLDTSVARTEGFAVDNLEFNMALTEAMHVALEAGKFDGAKCYLFMVDYTDLAKGAFPLASGYIGEITRDQGLVKAEILGLMSRLSRKLGRVYTTECDAILGDDRCRVPMLDRTIKIDVTIDLATNVISRESGSFSTDGFSAGGVIHISGSTLGNDGAYTVATEGSDAQNMIISSPAFVSDETEYLTFSIINNRTFTKAVSSVNAQSPQRIFAMDSAYDSLGAIMPDQWLFAGVVTFLTGANVGESRDVSSHVNLDLECYLEFPFAITVGDTFTVSVGCDLLRTTCKDKFNNIVNHRGFPFAPSNVEIYYSPAQIA